MSIATINTEQLSRGTMQVRVVKVVSPTLFWVHLGHNKAYYDEFLEDLNIYMDRKKDKMRIIPHYIKLNEVVVVKTRRGWQRGIVVRFNEDDTVQIFLRDWGFFIRHSQHDLYRLEKHFSEEAWLAIPCGLANAGPISQGRWWSQETKTLTRLLMENQVGWFKIVESVHAEGALVRLNVLRRQDDNSKDMLETLIQLGHARRTEESLIVIFPTVDV